MIAHEKKQWSYFDCRTSWWWCPGRCSAGPHGPSGPASSLLWPLYFERLCWSFNNIAPRLPSVSPQPSAGCSLRSTHGDLTLTDCAAVIQGPKFSQVGQRDGRLVRISSRKWGQESRGKEAHCTHGRSESFPASSFQVERSEGVCVCPLRVGPPVRWYFFLVLLSVEHSRPLIVHSSPLPWRGLSKLSAERRWSHSWGAGLRVYYLVLISPPLSACRYLWLTVERGNTMLFKRKQLSV